jgi:hypothetical protein
MYGGHLDLNECITVGLGICALRTVLYELS